MKRRGGSTRRPVLDVDNRSSSWKNKYQQIPHERSLNGKIDAVNPLSKLVGNYASDSEGEDESSKEKSLLDSKVEEFLKEVESTKTSDDSTSIVCPWQECYDEGTGYPYYWNMNTNEVTWEMPPELVAYQAAVAATLAQSQAKVKEQAQHAQWAVEQAALGLTPEIPAVTQKFSLGPAPPLMKKPPVGKDVLSKPLSRKARKARQGMRPSSDSEDEKIEMITSWADEDSEEDDEEIPKKEIKSLAEKNQLKPKDNVPKSHKLNPGSISSHKVSKPQKPGPPPVTVYGPQLPENNKMRNQNGSADDPMDSEPKVAVQKLRRLKTEADVIVGTREKVPVRKSVDRSRSGSPSDRLNPQGKLGETTGDSSTAEEKLIHARLCKQVQVLRDLGGEVPNEVKDLIDSDTKTSGPPLASADNIIALIEMEQPPDHKQNISYLSSLRAAEKSMETAVLKIKSENNSRSLSVSTAKKIDHSKPSSFALIAGYGDDSDQEDTVESESSVSTQETAKQNPVETKVGSLFPIVDHQESNSMDKYVSKDNAKPVPENDASINAKVSQEHINSKMQLVIDHSSGQKRKKRIDVPLTSTPLQPSSGAVKEGGDETVKPGKDGNSSTSYTTTWTTTSTYASDPTANDRRGFGFQVPNNGPEEASRLMPKPPQKGKIQFIKAEILNHQETQLDSTTIKETMDSSTKKPASIKSTEEEQLRQHVSSLAHLVVAKLRFLSDGKDPVSPVQAMAIQIETLMSAWNAGALTQNYLHRWLQSTGAELVELERAAAPKGWAVQWDRTYKRYFYCNLATKDTQWDYPVISETGEKPRREVKGTPELEIKRQPSPPPEYDEDAMELCTTPPLPDEGEEQIPSTQSRSPSPPAPKRAKTDDADEPNIPSTDHTDSQCRPPPPPVPNQPPLPASPPPPLPSSPPPPPPDTPPPPSGSPAPSHVTEHGEPLPPGVDTPELPYMSVRPSLQTTAVSLTSELGAHLSLNTLPIHSGPVMAAVPVMTAMPIQYPATVSSSYVPPPPTEAMLASYNSVDYMGYMGVYAGPAPMPVASVAAPPLTYSGPGPQPPAHTPHVPQRKTGALLSEELSSFYSDIASLDSNSRDAIEDETSQEAIPVEQPVFKPTPHPATVMPPTRHCAEEPDRSSPVRDSCQTQTVVKPVTPQPETTPDVSLSKKKKKPRLAPGLTLKKKGVSNLVAKWQQVQQEVWKDYQTLSDEDAD